MIVAVCCLSLSLQCEIYQLIEWLKQPLPRLHTSQDCRPLCPSLPTFYILFLPIFLHMHTHICTRVRVFSFSLTIMSPHAGVTCARCSPTYKYCYCYTQRQQEQRYPMLESVCIKTPTDLTAQVSCYFSLTPGNFFCLSTNKVI